MGLHAHDVTNLVQVCQYHKTWNGLKSKRISNDESSSEPMKSRLFTDYIIKTISA